MAKKSPDLVVDINGFTVRFIRVLRGRTVAGLAANMPGQRGERGCDRSYITHIENGTKTRVSVEFFNALLLDLDIPDHRILLANPHATTAAQVPA